MEAATVLPIITVKQSDNSKLSADYQKVSATYAHIGQIGDKSSTCPNDCPMRAQRDPETGEKKNPCYGLKSHCSIHQERAADQAGSLLELFGTPYIRHHVTGDAFRQTSDGRSILDREKVRAMLDFHRVSKKTIGWNYTHRFQSWDAAGLGPDAWPDNFVTLASVHTLAQKALANASGWTTARVIDKPEDRTTDEFLCPYDLQKYRGKKPTANCVTCQKCFPGQNTNIAFIKF